MPKRIAEDEKRVPLNCLIAPETKQLLQTLKEMNRSQGEIVDKAVAAWARFGETVGVVAQLMTLPITKPRQFKGPLLKPKDRK